MLQKIEHYISALAQLEQAVAIYQKSQQDALYRDGLIQRFEFTVELAWKSIKEYLEDQGSTTPIATPRAVLKEAFAAGVIQDAEEWNKIITARNITSHVYDEKTAEDVAQLAAIGADAVLIGETLMRAPDKTAKLQELKGLL